MITMWLVNDRLQCRLKLAEHDDDTWCFTGYVPNMPCDSSDPTAWRLVYEPDPSGAYYLPAPGT